MKSLKRKIIDQYLIVLFLLPILGLYMMFFVYPFLKSVFISFTDYKIVTGKWTWIGLDNYVDVITDSELPKILLNTFIYSGIYIPISIGCGLALAILVESIDKGKEVLRTFIFMPVIIASSVTATVFSFLLNKNAGFIPSLIEKIGKTSPDFLNNTDYALVVVALIGVWKMSSYVFLFYSAALQSVDQHLIEAAKIDSANGLQTYWYVILPSMIKTHIFVFFITLTSSFQSFESIHILTQGGPNNYTNVLYYKIYQEGFNYYDMGRASALSVLVLAIIILVFIVRQYFSKRRRTI